MSENYNINNEEWDSMDESKTVKKMESASMSNSQLPDGYEIVETEDHAKTVMNDIQEAAKAEGLVSDEQYLGGEGASPEEVIKALKNEKMPEGARKNKEEYEDKKLDDFREITATRDLLFQRLNKPIKISLPMGKDADGVEVRMNFYVRKLSETENNHLLNHTLIGKQLNELTLEEYQESMKFRRRTLASAVIEPKLSEEEWASKVDNALVTSLFEKVQDALTNVNDAELFQ